MKLSYRKMTIDDLPAVFSVRVSTVENAITLEALEEDYDITPESLEEAMSSNVCGWLCEDSEVVVGFSMGDRSNGEVLVVAVLPEYEGYGIGKTLLTHAQNWLFSEGFEEIWLGANPDPTIRAYGFYKKLGWIKTGKMKGEDEIMVLRKINC
ncbi:MAG: GNAT family N-acetyltransferase [Desulfobacterales bacterium]|nr:GNAT family N-acetyltransferase [Desulfobacterales bacterium]